MIAAWATAWAADPVAARSLAPDGAVVVATGGTSAAVTPLGWPTVGVVARHDGGAVGAFAAVRTETTRDDGEFRWLGGPFAAVGVAGSVLALPVARGAAAGVAPWAGVGGRGNAGGWALTAAVPAVVGTGPDALRLPVVGGLELVASVHSGWGIGVVATGGASYTPGLGVEAVGDVGLAVVRADGCRFCPADLRFEPPNEGGDDGRP